MADFRKAGAVLLVDDPLAGHAVAERHATAGDRAGNEGHFVHDDGDGAGTSGVGGREVGGVLGGEIGFVALGEFGAVVWREIGGFCGRRCGGGLRGGGGFADVAYVGFRGGVLQGELKVVDEESDVAVGEGNLEVLE